LGYDLSRVQQTGSNFGTQLRHDSPFLTTVGTGTMVSDGLSVVNVEMSSTSFRIDPVVVGERKFIGNDVAFPAGARTGDNCLLATKVMIPVGGPVHQDTGLLGSPPFEIPRNSPRPHSASHPATPEELRSRLAAKNRYNARTVAVVLLLRLVGAFASLLAIAVLADLWAQFDVLAIAVGLITVPLILIVYSAVLERAVLGFRPLTPQACSIYDSYFWHHERLWKFYISPALRGTPFTSLIWRLAGLRIGRQVSMMAASSRRRPWSPSAMARCSTLAASSRATRWRTVTSSPATSASGPGPASASTHSSITASPSGRAPPSPPMLSS
jgi:non-ribosomal peptide synthetase-like protein